MKRDLNSARSARWRERNCLENESCVTYVFSLCNYFDFVYYKIEYYENEKSVWITYMLDSYIIKVDNKNVYLKVYKKRPKTDYCYELLNKYFYGDSCWYRCFEWIKNRNYGVTVL